MKQFDFYASDLTEEAQKSLCEFLGISDLSEENYDVFPITTLYVDDNEEECEV